MKNRYRYIDPFQAWKNISGMEKLRQQFPDLVYDSRLNVWILEVDSPSIVVAYLLGFEPRKFMSTEDFPQQYFY